MDLEYMFKNSNENILIKKVREIFSEPGEIHFKYMKINR